MYKLDVRVNSVEWNIKYIATIFIVSDEINKMKFLYS